jgi:hypothetical protein
MARPVRRQQDKAIRRIFRRKQIKHSHAIEQATDLMAQEASTRFNKM